MEPTRTRLPFPWLFRWKFWRILLLIVAGLITAIALFHAEENWRGKRAWESYKREMEGRGEVLDFAKYVPPPVPDDQNFAMTPLLAPLFDFFPGTQRQRNTNGVQRLQQAAELPNEVQMTLHKTGWPVGSPLDFVRLANEFVATNRSAPDRFSPGQTQEAARVILEKLKPMETVFDELRQASQRPYSRFNIDYDWDPKFGILLPELAPIKEFCSKLELRACSELAAGDSQAAFQDVRLMFPLMNSIRNEPFLISELVRVACLTGVLQPIWEGLAHHQWSDEQLAEFAEKLRALDFLDDDVRALQAESHCSDSFFADLRASRDPVREANDVIDPAGKVLGAGFASAIGVVIPRGWIYFEQLNYHRLYRDEFDGVVTAKGIDPEVVDRKDAEVRDELISRGGVSRILDHLTMSRILLPSLSGFERKMARAQSYANLAYIGCALERCRHAQGQFPENLDALVPQFLPSVPRDIIMEQPLKYRRSDDGRFVLYSVGWNKTDDGGLFVKESQEMTQGDWVWEYPAAPTLK